MQNQRRRDTAPEVALRKELHRLGFRFRVDHPVLRGVRRRADIAFTRAKVAVFVDGCFWHSCPIHATSPKANAEWWADKLAANVRRDRATDEALRTAGWEVVRIWEHSDVVSAAEQVRVELILARASDLAERPAAADSLDLALARRIMAERKPVIPHDEVEAALDALDAADQPSSSDAESILQPHLALLRRVGYAAPDQE